MARECGVALLPAVVILRDSGVHVGGPNSGNVPAKVEGMIYQQLCFGPILRTRFSSGPPALLEPSTNSVLLSLC